MCLDNPQGIHEQGIELLAVAVISGAAGAAKTSPVDLKGCPGPTLGTAAESQRFPVEKPRIPLLLLRIFGSNTY